MSAKSKTARRLVRKQVLITDEQNRLLAARSQSTNTPVAEIVRAAIDRELGLDVTDSGWRDQLLALAGSLADEPGLDTAVTNNRQRWSTRTRDILHTLSDND